MLEKYRGEKGLPGPQGDTGERGRVGPPGRFLGIFYSLVGNNIFVKVISLIISLLICSIGVNGTCSKKCEDKTQISTTFTHWGKKSCSNTTNATTLYKGK